MSNPWCTTLKIDQPSLAAARYHREANTYVLLIVALLEKGAPMTLVEVAAAFDQAGVADAWTALAALKRCKPARAPVYRVGELYHLDPHDEDLDLWVFRLGLRPPRVAAAPPPLPVESELPRDDVALTVAELNDAWKEARLTDWSAQRLVLAVLDAAGAPRAPAEVVAALSGRTRDHRLRPDEQHFSRRGSAVQVLANGDWAIDPAGDAALRSARLAVRKRAASTRHWAALRPAPGETEARMAEWEKRRAAKVQELAKLTRALLVTFPSTNPQAAALVDVEHHEITTYVGHDLRQLVARLADFDIIGAIDVRATLRALGFDHGQCQLAELGPPKKSHTLRRSGRVLKISAELIIKGSCGISQPLGDQDKMAAYLAAGDIAKLERRLQTNAKSLYALYNYGLLHKAVRLRHGSVDERMAVPWVSWDAFGLADLMRKALELDVPLEVVVGAAPEWDRPWARAQRVWVERDQSGHRRWLVDAGGFLVEEAEVQLARLGVVVH